MSVPAVMVLGTGLVSSVGLTAPAACAAIRAGLTNPTETRFMDSNGEWIRAHCVPLSQPWSGITRLARMVAPAIEECLQRVPREQWSRIPLLVGVAESERPGRLPTLDSRLIPEIESELGVGFADGSAVIPGGRAAAAVALLRAREMILSGAAPMVVAAGTDSLLDGQTLLAYERNHRLLTSTNSNGFLPGEGAGAVLLGGDTTDHGLRCRGVALATERATVESDEPLRADGLTAAVAAALAEAQCAMHELDLRIVDVSGEQYYFKEATLVVSRLMRVPKAEFDIWHPAECIGEAGAVAGFAALAVADASCRKGYAPGSRILCHLGTDGGVRAALVLEFGSG